MEQVGSIVERLVKSKIEQTAVRSVLEKERSRVALLRSLKVVMIIWLFFTYMVLHVISQTRDPLPTKNTQELLEPLRPQIVNPGAARSTPY